ncbi:MAG: metallophosphoesterase family protein [Candidatus Omnitrophica bacterium]|nr:metallophosphoesterase family protein [Candidatus Omnitrophota bacterium]
MRFAILADIHSNWEALEAAHNYLLKQKIGEYWVLGDSIGYGASPNECLAWVFKHAKVSLMGNHEKAIVDIKLLDWFNTEARTAIEWTEKVLSAEYKEKINDLRYVHITNSSTLAHGSPDSPEEFRYLFSFEQAVPSFKTFKTQLCFVGHTHLPSQFIESSESVNYLHPDTYPLDRKERYILNPGSVGQPRDRDPRLSFGIFDDEKWSFELVRLEYDNKKAARKIREAGLPRYLADRLL